MSRSIDKTLQLLGMSKNKAAARLLESALVSSYELVRQLAGRELVSSRGTRGLIDLIEQADQLDDTTFALFDKHREKMVSALRSAIISQDPRLNRNAFRIILSRRYFEVIPTLLKILLESGGNSNSGSPLPEMIDRLSSQYVQALEGSRQRRYLRETVLASILRVLSPPLLEFRRSDSPLIPLLFLRLYPYISAEYQDLTKILRDPMLPIYRVLNNILLSEDIRIAHDFVLHCLNNPNPPLLAQTVFSRRTDIPFLERIFDSLDAEESPNFVDNLKRMQNFDWLDQLRVILDQLENASQKGLVTVVRFAHLPREKRQLLLFDIVRYGKPAGRLAALNLLTPSADERVDQLIWQACDDSDPEIQALALKQLCQRRLPKATVKVIEYADSPHPLVRETVRTLLPELRFNRFLEMFDQMSEEQRLLTFRLIKKVDPNLIEEVRNELQFGDPVLQAKSLLCIEYGEMVPTFEEELCALLMRTENSTMRTKVAKLLAAGRREMSRGMLVQAFHRDISPEVRAAAQESLENRPTPWEVK